ncbi:MAG: hypothetical protein ACYT04_46680, partial [Nostoc sp.]
MSSELMEIVLRCNDIAIAWRDWQDNKPNSDSEKALQQEELCRVSLWQAQDFLKKLKKDVKKDAWVWDGLKGDWVEVTHLYPGITILLHISDGGYSETLGYTGNPKDKPTVVKVADAIQPEKYDADFDTQVGKYISLKQHSVDVESEVRELCAKLGNYNLPTDILARSGRWHDLGKARKVFQE